MSWEVREAIEWAKRLDIAATYPPCPNCGAKVDPHSIRLINVTTWGDTKPRFIHDDTYTVACSDRCWEKDPWSYVAAVNGAQP